MPNQSDGGSHPDQPPISAAPPDPAEPTPDPLQTIRADLQRRESDAAEQAALRARREQLEDRFGQRYSHLTSFACGLLAPEQCPQGSTFVTDLARGLLAFNETIREYDR